VGIQISRFSTNLDYMSETIQDRAIVTMEWFIGKRKS